MVRRWLSEYRGDLGVPPLLELIKQLAGAVVGYLDGEDHVKGTIAQPRRVAGVWRRIQRAPETLRDHWADYAVMTPFWYGVARLLPGVHIRLWSWKSEGLGVGTSEAAEHYCFGEGHGAGDDRPHQRLDVLARNRHVLAHYDLVVLRLQESMEGGSKMERIR